MTKKPRFSEKDYQNPREKYDEPSLSRMVFNYLSQENYNRSQKKSKERRDNLRFYPSSLGMSDRDIVLSMLGYIGTPQRGEQIMVLENGTSFHNRMEAIFEDMGIMIAPELSLKSPELYLSGRSDAIIWNYLRKEDDPDGEIITLTSPSGETLYHGPENYVLLVEFKSIAENGFYQLTKSHPKPVHEQQLQLYFHLTGITKGIVYYENKNNQKVQEYIVDKDENVIDAVLTRIHYLIDCAKERKIPEADYVPTDMKALFSSYTEMTFPNPNPFRFEDLFKTEEQLANEPDVPF